MGFDFEIKYKAGNENRVANALSRKMKYSAISSVTFCDWTDLEDEIQANDRLRRIFHDLLRDAPSYPGFEINKGRLYYKGRLVIAKNSAKIPQLLQGFHDSYTGGHSGFFRIYKRISGLLY